MPQVHECPYCDRLLDKTVDKYISKLQFVSEWGEVYTTFHAECLSAYKKRVADTKEIAKGNGLLGWLKTR